MGYERTLPSREPSWSELSWSWRDRAMTEYIHLIDLLLIHIWRNMKYFDSNNGYFESFDVIYITYKYNIEDILKMLEHLIIGEEIGRISLFTLFIRLRVWDEIRGKSGISKFQRINGSSIENVADETLFLPSKNPRCCKNTSTLCHEM